MNYSEYRGVLKEKNIILNKLARIEKETNFNAWDNPIYLKLFKKYKEMKRVLVKYERENIVIG